MATTVTTATLTSTITESITLNGQTYGNTITHQVTTQGEVKQRIMSVGTDITSVLSLGASDQAGTVVGDNMNYLRITNLDDTNYITLQFTYASTMNVAFKLRGGESFILGNNQSVGNAHNTTLGTLEDITGINALANTDAVDIELFVVTP